MKKNLLLLVFALCICISVFSQSGKKIYFTIAKDASQSNKVNVYAKNTSGSTITGEIGASLLGLCIALPSSLSAQPTITASSPIAGVAFADALPSTYDTWNVYTYSATGSKSVSFESNKEVLIASFVFSGVQATSTVVLANIPKGGSETGGSGIDVCYIAPGGVDESDYSSPFYSNTPSDPNLNNCGGDNDPTTNCFSSVGAPNVSLPVNWLSFTASLKNSATLLNWSAEEKKGSYFEVTRSLDGAKFAALNKVASKGDGTNAYTYLDEAVTKVKSDGNVYYQIIQVDKDGKRSPSAVRTVTISLPVGGISVSPNPVRSVATVRFNHPRDEKATLLVTDVNGKVVYQAVTQLQKGFNQKDINASAFSSGNYNLNVISNLTNKTIKLVKVGN